MAPVTCYHFKVWFYLKINKFKITLKYNAKINIRNDVLYNEIETELKTKIVGLDLLDNNSYISPDFYTYVIDIYK